MRVLLTALNPEGGIRTFFRYIYGHTVFSNTTFFLIAPDNGLTEYLNEFIPDGRFHVINAKTERFKFIRHIRSIIKNNSFELIHSHGFSAGLLTEISRTGIQHPHIMSAHDVFLSNQFAGVKGQIKKYLMSILFQRMTGIHAVGLDARENILETFSSLRRDCVYGILNGIDTNLIYNSEPAELKDVISLPKDVPLIGFFGRFMGQKGFRILIEAMQIIEKERLLVPMPHVVTFGWNGYIREDYSYLNDLGLGKYFHQQEQTNNIGSMLKGVDLVVMPSRWEACPLLPMEALTAGIPIIGSDCIGLREVLADTPAHTFTTGNVVALANAITSELSEIKSRKKVFAEYQSIAVNRFSLDQTATSLASLYSELTSVVRQR